jgi:hypothetical protein
MCELHLTLGARRKIPSASFYVYPFQYVSTVEFSPPLTPFPVCIESEWQSGRLLDSLFAIGEGFDSAIPATVSRLPII